jgi:hypothetical protein
MWLLPRAYRAQIEASGYYVHVPHAYFLAGFDIIQNIGFDLDDYGLEWVRTFNLRHRDNGIEYRMIEPDDMHVVLGHEYPAAETLASMYGKLVSAENVRWLR